MYTSYTGEQEANMSMYKLTLHFKYSEKILQFVSSQMTKGLGWEKVTQQKRNVKADLH